jgi:hypothetical protein
VNESDNKTDATAVITTTITAVHQQSLHQQIAAEVTHVLFVGCCITTKTKIFLFYSMRISCPFLLCIPVVKWNKNFDLKKKNIIQLFLYRICLQLCADRERQKKNNKKTSAGHIKKRPKTKRFVMASFFFIFGRFFFLRRRRRTCETWKCDLIIFLVDNKNGNINNKTFCCWCCCCVVQLFFFDSALPRVRACFIFSFILL